MRVLVCGGRNYNNRERVFNELYALDEGYRIKAVIHGAARGADYLAGEWAKTRDILEIPYPADWERDGKAAGPIRNQLMLDEEEPDVVLAFPGGPGTADMCARARLADIRLEIVGSEMTIQCSKSDMNICVYHMDATASASRARRPSVAEANPFREEGVWWINRVLVRPADAASYPGRNRR